MNDIRQQIRDFKREVGKEILHLKGLCQVAAMEKVAKEYKIKDWNNNDDFFRKYYDEFMWYFGHDRKSWVEITKWQKLNKELDELYYSDKTKGHRIVSCDCKVCERLMEIINHGYVFS